MAAVSGQLLENLTKKTLTKIRTDLTIFMLTLPTSREGLVGKPLLPRKRRTPDRLEVGAGAPSHLQTAKDHFQEGSIMRLFILSSGLSISALIRKASAPTPRWKPSSVVKAANGDDYEAEFSFLKHHTAQMLIQGSVGATKYFGSYVKGGEDIMF